MCAAVLLSASNLHLKQGGNMRTHRATMTAVVLALSIGSCRRQVTPVDVGTGQFGSGSGYTASCGGDFPSWITVDAAVPTPDGSGDVNPNEAGIQKPFELAQDYPLGTPVFATVNGKTVIDHYDPPQPNVDAPWRAFTNLTDAGQRASYLNALKTYVLQNMSDTNIQFDATKNNQTPNTRKWFHVPMMTAASFKRREPYHGVTAERALDPAEQTHWLTGVSKLRAVAIGYYNSLGGYTIGQVFKSYDLSQTDPSQAKFIDGTLVFKLLFAEYVPARIIAPDPLLHAPAWWVQDPGAPTNPLTQVRLLQVDVAVKDDHFAGTTGWVFATFVYDESQAATEPNPWRRLAPVGIMWGNDPGVTSVAPTTLVETQYSAVPAAFLDHKGRGGRLIGPVDNPVSSCLSCHSTAEVDMAKKGDHTNFYGAALYPPQPPSTCVDPMPWFRNLASGPSGSVAFGHGIACLVDTSPSGLTSLDYSLQLQQGVAAVFAFNNANPCAALAAAAAMPPPPPPSGAMSTNRNPVTFRALRQKVSLVRGNDKESIIGPDPPESQVR